MPGPILDYKAEPGYDELYNQLLAEMNAAGEITDLRPWMTRALQIDREIMKESLGG